MVFIGGAVLANIVRPSPCLMHMLLMILTPLHRCRTRRACGLLRRNGRSRARALWRSSAVDDHDVYKAIRKGRKIVIQEADSQLQAVDVKTKSHLGRPALTTPQVFEMRYQSRKNSQQMSVSR